MKDDAAAVEKESEQIKRPLHADLQGVRRARHARTSRFHAPRCAEGLGARWRSAPCSPSRAVLAAAPPATAVTPALIEAAKKEGKVVYYTSVDLPLAEKIAKAFEARYPGVARARSSAPAPSACSSASARSTEPHLRGRRGELLGRRAFHRLEARGLARAIRAGGRGEALSRRAQGCRRGCSRASASGSASIAYNTNLVKAGGGAEELRRSARSEMERQDGEGASGLQRHHHDRDVPAAARSRLGLSGEARAAEASCSCSRRPIRRRSSRSASAPMQADGNEYNIFQIKEGGGPVETGLCRPRARRWSIGPNGVFKNAPNPNAARLFQSFVLLGGVPAAHRRRRRAALGASAGQGEAGPQAAVKDIKTDEGGRGRRSRRRRGDQEPAMHRSSRYERARHARQPFHAT